MNNFHKVLDFIVCYLSHFKNRRDFHKLRTRSGNYSLKGFDDKSCIFVHIPKSAGISVNTALFGSYGGGHLTVKEYKRIFGPVVYRNYFSFTFVRNPYERLYSAWNFLRNGGFKEDERIWAENNIMKYDLFSDFVLEWLNSESIWKINHFKPQYFFVCDLNNHPEVDFIGRVENIDEDFQYVCNQLGVENSLPRLNCSQFKDSNIMTAYTSEAFEKVNRLYDLDFKIFDYSKIEN